MAVERLGDGTYEVYFKTRGGSNFICRARDFVALSWGRRMNEVSTASVTIALNGIDPQCAECAAQINPWEHELAIFRNGIEVWVGPVVNGTIDPGRMTATYEARDLSAWFDHRWLELRDTDVEFEEANISEIFEWLINHAYSKQPWNMEWVVPEVKIPMDKVYIAAAPDERWSGEFQSIGDEMRSLSESGIDTTTVRRQFIVGDLEAPSEPIQILTDVHWATLPIMEITGASMATEVGVGGGNGGYYGWYDDQIWIERGGAEAEKYGLLQSFFNAPELDEEDTEKSPNAITQQAYNLRELKKEPFVYLKGGSLSSKAPIDMDDLIPGNVFNVRMVDTVRPLEANYRLFTVNVSYGASGEDIAIELTPLGADALA